MGVPEKTSNNSDWRPASQARESWLICVNLSPGLLDISRRHPKLLMEQKVDPDARNPHMDISHWSGKASALPAVPLVSTKCRKRNAVDDH
ncbi:MAG: hypothetical protein ACSHXI_01890 [Hoeflea sp.]|uniref:hypothetical protein n=1 Tax=Hoeflea sp. TaxID=1940281 RepID=UPI003EF709A1